jgi:3-hydroxybutyryl-CoA dehydrogenase
MDMKNITVLGAGTMGRGIAQAAAMAGFSVVLYDIKQEFVDGGVAGVRKILGKSVEKGKRTQEEVDGILGRIKTSIDLAAAAKDADFVIEAIPENLDLKKKVFAELDKVCKPSAILASNTSSMPVTAIAAATKRPSQVIGTHFFNPAAVMKLVEVVMPIGVSEETVQIAMDFCKKLGKVPVRTKDTPGFIVNALLGPFYQTAAQMVLDGVATAEDIDTAMKLGANHPMGPCELADFGGFDIIANGSDEMFKYTSGKSGQLCLLYRKMIEAGRLGRKNGKGFYDYLPDGTKVPFKLL